MAVVEIHLNPYRSQSRIITNGLAAPQYGALQSLQGKPLLSWCKSVLPMLQRAVNDRYELVMVSGEIEADIMRCVANEPNPYCTGFRWKRPELDMPTGERLAQFARILPESLRKGLYKNAYAELYLSDAVDAMGYFARQTHEAHLEAGESYGFDMPQSLTKFGPCELSASMQRFDPALVQSGLNTVNILVAQNRQDADAMLRRIHTQEPLLIFLYAPAGDDGLVAIEGNLLLFQVHQQSLAKRISQAADFKIITPLINQISERLLRELHAGADPGCADTVLAIQQILGIEPFYRSDAILSMTGGASVPLVVRRYPRLPENPTLMVRCSPQQTLVYQDGRLYADDIQRAVQAEVEVYVSGLPAPVATHQFFIYPDETPTTLHLHCPSKALNAGMSVRLTAEVSHARKSTPKTTEWLSSNTAVATVDADGTVRALASGTCVITARRGPAVQAEVEIRVYQSLRRIALSNPMIHLQMGAPQGDRVPLAVYTDRAAYDATDVRWVSSNASISFTPHALTPEQRGADAQGQLVLTEGYVESTAVGRGTLEFLSVKDNGAVRAACSVITDRAAAPIPPPRAKASIPWRMLNILLLLVAALLLGSRITPLGQIAALLAAACGVAHFVRNRFRTLWDWVLLGATLLVILGAFSA